MKFPWTNVASKQMEELVRSTIDQAISNALNDKTNSITLNAEIDRLTKEKTKLQIEYDREKERWDRTEREIEHKLGLEKRRQEQEIQLATRETTVKVREENLSGERELFKKEMEFQRSRLEGEVQSLRDLTGKLLKALPSAEIIANINSSSKDSHSHK